MTTHPSAQAFRAAVEARDLGALRAVLAPDVVLHSPVTFHPYVGREDVGTLLGLVSDTFGDITYTDELDGPDGVTGLVLSTTIGERELQVLDLLRANEDGLVADLTVMVRPLSGLVALAQALQPKAIAAGLTAAA